MIHVTALVPMRHASERVPGKNYRPLGGLPLYRHIIDALTRVPHVERIVIDTDSPAIADDSAGRWPRVSLLERPADLRADDVPMNAIIAHDLRQVPGEFFVQTHSTNPLLRAETIAAAIEAFADARPARDSLFSVTRRQVRLWDGAGAPMNHDPSALLRTQDLAPVFEENSNLYIFSRTSFLRAGNRIGAAPLMFEIDRIEAWDIDDERDFRIAEALWTAGEGRRAR